ncbi:DEAD/DEAH box helicase [Xylocopilactobacillus apis]|uniref:DNA/RNA helicase n=1 Tax=Xylocopilactobacillus apis TaxID=2932183 RepID=A0AAU9CWY1_9LACO|nr:DEAD/DEAH box helicase family protein [Xylocopilactobacillus apis]BDR55798.1 DNA/RNA helicase [Xylocopilactobacillus apis]
MANEELLFGRQLLDFQLPEIKKDLLLNRPAMKIINDEIICERCSTQYQKNDVCLPTGDYYCPNCVNLGRVTSSDKLYHLPEFNLFPKNINYLVFNGTLTKAQQRLSDEVIEAILKRKSLLLWAVTGAGKTEMMFPGLNEAFKQGLRVCWATPRIDVVLELAPRLEKVFPDLPISVLYGSNEEPYSYCQFVLCTTHQLLRFYQAFDVLIIDEVDSFPYAGNKSLAFAADHSVKQNASRIYLSATPPDELTEKVPTAYLPQRFHGHPLPVPKCIYLGKWRQFVKTNRLPRKVKRVLAQGLKNKERYLIFVSEISLLDKLKKAFNTNFKKAKCATVYAGDEKRKEKVQDFRTGKYDVLFTTTILERGVTIFHINVLVIGAESKVFNWSSLVQIAGRAGRDKDHYDDQVIFYFSDYTKDLKKAVTQIKYLNQKAAEND